MNATEKLGTDAQNTRNRGPMKACMSHTRLPTMDSGRRSTKSARHVEKQPPNVTIKLTRPYPLPLRALLTKASLLTKMRIRSN